MLYAAHSSATCPRALQASRNSPNGERVVCYFQNIHSFQSTFCSALVAAQPSRHARIRLAPACFRCCRQQNKKPAPIRLRSRPRTNDGGGAVGRSCFGAFLSFSAFPFFFS